MSTELDDHEPEGFVADHFDRKQARQQRRKTDRRQNDGGKRIGRVGKKERWQFDRSAIYDDEEA